jgi:hypothetical protein
MRAFRDFVPGAPDELGLWIGLQTVPSTVLFPEEFWGHGVCIVMVCYKRRCAIEEHRAGIVTDSSALSCRSTALYQAAALPVEPDLRCAGEIFSQTIGGVSDPPDFPGTLISSE